MMCEAELLRMHMLTLVALHSLTNERCAENDVFWVLFGYSFLFDTLRQLMASFYFFKFPHNFDGLLLSSVVLHFSGVLNLLLERLMTLIDQARNFDFANLLHNMKNVTGP